MSKKIISILMSIIAVMSCVAPMNLYADTAMKTTQDPVDNVLFSNSLAPFSEFNSKITEGAFYIPGLNRTVSYNNEFKCYSETDTMVPQAMCVAEQFTLITAYDSEETSKSVIYVLDHNKILVKTLILPDSYHVGGITYDVSNKLILVTKGSKREVGVISFDDFSKYLRFNSPFVKIKYTISESVSNVKSNSASGVTYRNGRVYISAFGSGSSSYAYCYIPSYDALNNTYYLTYQYRFSIPDYTQGITISNYKDKTRLFVSVSYGRNESKYIYCSYLYTYSFDETTGSKSFDNILACPPMLQQTYCLGGKLYCLFESASKLYRLDNRDPIDIVIPLKLSLICDEKQGNNINVTYKSVSNGKSVNIKANIPNAVVYYSSVAPYICRKKITNGYKFGKAYTKTASGMVYAIAVLDGRIVAADAQYIAVSKASAPTKLKVKSKSSKSVTLSWKTASSSSGYFVYRSTKKNGDYVRVGTVKGNKGEFKDKNVKAKKNYYYKVKAYRNGYTNSSFTSYVKVTTKKS